MNRNLAKIATIALLIGALVEVSISGSDGCGVGCIQCFKGQECEACYLRESITTNFSCGRLDPPSDPCRLNAGPNCVACKQGYAYDYTTEKCLKTVINNCYQAYIYEGKSYCSVCVDGYPSKDQSSCIPRDQFNKPLANCLWGFIKRGGYGCFRCREGYTGFPVTDVGTNCIKTNIKGCLKLYSGERDRCAICDYENGWFAVDDSGICKRAD